jgi:hypothetical protein
MQYDDRTNRTTDPDMDDADRPVPQPDPDERAGSDDGGEALAEYSVVDESVVDEPDEQADDSDARGGSDQVWQGVQPVEGSEAVSEDPVTEDVGEDIHPTNVQPVSPDLGGVQPVDPDLGTGEPVDESVDRGQPVDESVDSGDPVDEIVGTDVPEDSELASTGLDETDTDGLAPEEDDPLRARWHEAQHLFVDDPAGAVHEAAALVREAAEQASSATKVESGTDAGGQSSSDTEWLRVSMQRYHEAFELLVGISSRDTA